MSENHLSDADCGLLVWKSQKESKNCMGLKVIKKKCEGLSGLLPDIVKEFWSAEDLTYCTEIKDNSDDGDDDEE